MKKLKIKLYFIEENNEINKSFGKNHKRKYKNLNKKWWNDYKKINIFLTFLFQKNLVTYSNNKIWKPIWISIINWPKFSNNKLMTGIIYIISPKYFVSK